MKTSKTFSVHFWLKKKSILKNGTIPIYARITVDGKRADISMKRSTLLEHWCSKSGLVKKRISSAKSINDYLNGAYVIFLDCHKKLTLERKLITAQAIKLRYLGEDAQSKTLKDLLRYHEEKETLKLEKGTTKNYKATEKYLLGYIRKKFKSTNVYLIQIDYAFVVNFENYLRIAPPLLKSKPLTNNGIMKHMERFHKMINIALRFGWLEKDPFALYQLKFNHYDRPFLTIGELQTVESVPLELKKIQRVRDIFVFACYCGLSYIDIKNLSSRNIIWGIDGDKWISIRRAKSQTMVKVPLLEKAKAILDKYSNLIEISKSDLLLPVYSNQKVNEYLKIIVNKCQIDKNISFHAARHTFATTVTLSNGVPLETVSKLLGHRKLSTTQIYARVLEKKISEDITVLRTKLKSSQISCNTLVSRNG